MTLLNNESVFARKIALIIVNDSYTDDENNLDHCLKNAQNLEQLLIAMNFETEFHHNLQTQPDTMAAVKRFTKVINDGDFILVFISGYGCQVNGRNYLIPTKDSHIEDDKNIEVLATSINKVLKRITKKRETCMITLILDCCRPYHLKSNIPPYVNDKGLHEMEAPYNTLIQFACASNRTTTNNLYFKHLVKNITEPDVKLVDIFKNVREDVSEETYKTQKPFTTYEWNEDDEIYLIELIQSKINIPKYARWNTKARSMASNSNYHHGPGTTLYQLNCPRGLFLTPNRTLMIADTLNHRIMRYRNNGKEVNRIAGKNIPGDGYDMLYAPTNIIYRRKKKESSIIICDSQNRQVVKVTLGLNKIFKIIIDDITCSGIAIDNEGFIYVSDSEYHEVRRYRIGSRYSEIVAGGHGQGSRPNQLNHPTYIFIGLDRSVYVSDSWNNRVMKWKEGAKEGIIVAGGHGKGKHPTQLDCPAGIAVDKYGTVYVADHWNHRVMRWRKNASHGDLIAGDPFMSGDKAHQLNGPEGLVFDSDGTLYVADSYNHRIQQYKIHQN
ncbi:hypothetical protein I4U23_020176 [Adineta vaga]|nr:hypothetical protein I4U23_020176 [Adineta vaga]